MSASNCERCSARPPPITSGPWAGSRHELRYCIYCSRDLCEACLARGKCFATPHGDNRHRVEVDCPECSGEGCGRCEETGTISGLVEPPSS